MEYLMYYLFTANGATSRDGAINLIDLKGM